MCGGGGGETEGVVGSRGVGGKRQKGRMGEGDKRQNRE